MASAKDIEEQAATWLIQLDAGATPAEWARLTNWLTENPRHRAAYLRLSKAWNDADALRKLRPLDCSVDPDLLARASRELIPQRAQSASSRWRTRFGWRGIGLGVASTLAVAVCGAVAWQFAPPLRAPTYETSFGATQRVSLPDGSYAQLNGDSAVRVEYSTSKRNVEIERGEVLFEVAPDVRRPFQVSTGTTRAIAAEGQFSVRRKSAHIVDVLVAEGQVAFERARAPLSFGAAGARFTRTLLGGDAARADRYNVVVRRIGVEAVYRRLEWRNGQVAFLGETLAEAVDEINRYNRQPVLIEDRQIASRRVSGTFRKNDPRSFVRSLEKPLHVKAVGEPNRIRLVDARR
jgi:transmembrane sensor